MSLKEPTVSLHRERLMGVASDAAQDAPTGAVATLLATEWAQALRLRQPLSLIVVTVDQFPAFCRQQGREQGEVHLGHLGQLLDAIARRARDSAGRCSADAFMLVLPETPADGAQVVAERCHQAIRAAQAEHPLTASIGAGTLIPRSEAGHSAFFNAVAQLCDEAARAGGDRVATRHFGQSYTGAMHA